MKVAMVKHKPYGKVFWFAIPEHLVGKLQPGFRVACNTARGRRYGTVVAADLDEQDVKEVMLASGATFPLSTIEATTQKVLMSAIKIPGYEDNPYGLSDDPDKRAGQFPYKHQSIQFCPNCYNGVVRFCPDCGKQIPRYRTLCDCDAVVQRRQQEENRKEKERLEKAEKHEPNALGSLFTMAQSDFYSHNEGYFSCWEDFFDSWNEDREEFTEKPLYVWGTEEVAMSFDASSIVSNACEDMYEDAYDDIGADAVAEMQRYLNEWKEKYGRTSYLLTTKHAIRIPWEEMK